MLRLFLIFILLIVPHMAAAEIIGTVNYEYKYNAAKGMSKPTFVICDCPSSPLAMAPKEVSMPQKNNVLLAHITIKAPDSSHEHDNAKAVKESSGEIKTEHQFGVAIGTVFFDFDSSELKKDAILRLEKIAHTIKTENLRSIVVNGYTCDIGSERYNDRLAQKRADAVASYLRHKGVDVEKVTGEGKCCYISYSKKENRRAEVIGYMPKKI